MHRKKFLEWREGTTLISWFQPLIEGAEVPITGWTAKWYLEDGLVVDLEPDLKVNAFLLQTRTWPAATGRYRWYAEAVRDDDGESIMLADGLLEFLEV